MQNATFQISCGSFVSVGHYVKNFNTNAVIVGVHQDINGEISPILRQVNSDNKLVGGKWVANTKFITK